MDRVDFGVVVSGTRPDILSFPTRRSSDLNRIGKARPMAHPATYGLALQRGEREARRDRQRLRAPPIGWRGERSEEHTSELQSRRDLVCRLLLVKKIIILIILFYIY